MVTITRDDAAWFEETLQNVHPTSKCRVEVVPFGMDVDGTPHAAMNEAPTRALHLGAMDWAPNHQGVSWFVQDVWPLVRQALPEAQVALAGRNMGPEWTSDENAGVHVLGEVDDAAATYDTPSVVVVPLHAGSGMRIKIAEALAAGRPIVTTTKGMTGLPWNTRNTSWWPTPQNTLQKRWSTCCPTATKPPPWANADELGPKSTCSTALGQNG